MDTIKKILIAIDDGPTSEKVALSGFQLGQQLNSEIALISVVDTTALMTEGGMTPKQLAESIFTRQVKIAFGLMIASNIYTTLGYFFHERVWDKIR